MSIVLISSLPQTNGTRRQCTSVLNHNKSTVNMTEGTYTVLAMRVLMVLALAVRNRMANNKRDLLDMRLHARRTRKLRTPTQLDSIMRGTKLKLMMTRHTAAKT